MLVRKLVYDPKVKLKYQHLITNSFVEVRTLKGDWDLLVHNLFLFWSFKIIYIMLFINLICLFCFVNQSPKKTKALYTSLYWQEGRQFIFFLTVVITFMALVWVLQPKKRLALILFICTSVYGLGSPCNVICWGPVGTNHLTFRTKFVWFVICL